MKDISAEISADLYAIENYRDDYRRYAEQDLKRKVMRKIEEMLDEGIPFALMPVGYYTRKDVNRIDIKYVVNVQELGSKVDGNNLLANKVVELAMEDSIVNLVPNQYIANCCHRPGKISLGEMDSNEIESIKIEHFYLIPVIDNKGDIQGFAGKCKVCGKVFYSECIVKE